MSSTIANCWIEMHDRQKEPMFRFRGDGTVTVHLDGYAIIPREMFEALVEIAERNAQEIAGHVIASARRGVGA